jgi:hypothetical protein
MILVILLIDLLVNLFICRTAAGVFEYIYTKELPRWDDMPGSRPLEVDFQVCQALTR